MRAEKLELVVDGQAAPIQLFDVLREPGQLTTQDIFQVSPNGAFLAYAYGDALHVRAADGSERAIKGYQPGGLMRFSADGTMLAAVLGERATAAGERIVLFDLRTGKLRELAKQVAVAQLEWMQGAVVALAWDSHRQVLIELPLTGEPVTLLEKPAADIERFVAASAGTRIAAFVRDGDVTRLLAFDAATPADTQELAVVRVPITNAAASRDGERIAFTTAAAVFVSDGGPAKAISARTDVDSLWFAADGRLGYASRTSATILEGKRNERFDREGPIAMLRFDPVSQQALVATPKHAWDAVGSHRLAAMPAGSELLGVDHFAGGLVLWTTSGISR